MHNSQYNHISRAIIIAVQDAKAMLKAPRLFRQGCALGLLNIQQYYGLSPHNLTQGRVEDPVTGQEFQAATRLNHMDALLVAKVASLLGARCNTGFPGSQGAEAPGRCYHLACRLP